MCGLENARKRGLGRHKSFGIDPECPLPMQNRLIDGPRPSLELQKRNGPQRRPIRPEADFGRRFMVHKRLEHSFLLFLKTMEGRF